MADIKIYRNYSEFDDMGKDPVIGRVRQMIEKKRLIKKLSIVHEISGVSRSTLYNWFNGETKRPQYATIMAVAAAMNYKMTFRQEERFDSEVALREAKKWYAQQEAKKRAAKARLIASRRAARSKAIESGLVRE